MKVKILCAAACMAVCGTYITFPAPIAAHTKPIRAEAATLAGAKHEKNGLVEEDGHFRYYEDGQPVTKHWATVEGNTYYFDKNGDASVLKCKINGSYFVFDEEGRLLQPSQKKVVRVETPDGEIQKYYVDKEGKAISGWSPDKTYYFDETGEMATGITVIKEKFYCFYASGKFNQKKTQKIRKAAKYESKFSNLKKYIGEPKKSKYYDSCYGAGKDGILTYDGFKVFTYRPGDGSEIFMGAE